MMEIIGRAPELAGHLCEGFICEGFVHNGQLVANANVIYVRFAGSWHKLVIDCGVIIWRPFQGEPSPFAIASEGWECPHIDVGAIAGVVGQPLQEYEMKTADGGSKVTFIFENGRIISIDNESDISTFRIK